MKKKLGYDLVLLGAPASGKNTQADILLKRYSLRTIETGKYLRQLFKTPQGQRKLGNNFGKGLPAPVSVIVDFIRKNVASVPRKQNLLFIGNPRLKPEAENLNRILAKRQRPYRVLYLKLPQAEIRKRTLTRLRDERDRNPAYFKNRIRFAKTEDAKTLKYFQKLGKLTVINGNQPVRSVAADIERKLK